MKALILAAGYATRLYPLTKEYPKPLLEVKNKPLIDYIIDKLEVVEEVDEIIVVTNSKFITKFQEWTATKKTRKNISLVDDLTTDHNDRRGAIGDMYFVVKEKSLNDDLLVIGGDNLFEDDLGKFIHFAKNKTPHSVIGVYDIKDKTQTYRYGVIKLDKENKIIDFVEKPKISDSTLVAMCLYYFPKEKSGLIKEYIEDTNNKNDATGFYIDWLRKKEPIYGYVFQGHWYDIGDNKFYHEAKEQFNN